MAKLYSKVTLADGSRDEACLLYSNVEVKGQFDRIKFERDAQINVGEGAKVEWLDQPLPSATATDPQLPEAVNESLMALDDCFLSLRTGELAPYDSWDEVKRHVERAVANIVNHWEG